MASSHKKPPVYEEPELGEFNSLRLKVGELELDVTGSETFIDRACQMFINIWRENNHGVQSQPQGADPGS